MCDDASQICFPKATKSACSSIHLASPAVTTLGRLAADDPLVSGTTPGELIFGAPFQRWFSYSYAAADQTAPVALVTADGDGFEVTADFTASVAGSNTFEGFGLAFEGPSCIDGSAYTGVQFDFSGDLGGRLLTVIVTAAENVTMQNDPTRGTCTGGAANCYGPSLSTNSILDTTNPKQIPFSMLTGGKPDNEAVLDPTSIVSVQWQLEVAANPHAQFTIKNVTFY